MRCNIPGFPDIAPTRDSTAREVRCQTDVLDADPPNDVVHVIDEVGKCRTGPAIVESVEALKIFGDAIGRSIGNIRDCLQPDFLRDDLARQLVILLDHKLTG